MLSDTNQDHRGDAQSACDENAVHARAFMCTEGGGGASTCKLISLHEYVMEADEANDSSR